MTVVALPLRFPGRPSPYSTNLREEIARVRLQIFLNQVGTRDIGNSAVPSKLLQEFLAEREKGWVWQTIVFKDDRVVDQREDPVQTADHPLLASKIDLGEVGGDLAGPVDPSDDVTYFAAGLGFSLSVLSWSICDEQQL